MAPIVPVERLPKKGVRVFTRESGNVQAKSLEKEFRSISPPGGVPGRRSVTVARPAVLPAAGVPAGRLQYDRPRRARHARLAAGVRPAGRMQAGVRLSRAQGAGAVRRLQRVDDPGAGLRAVLTHIGELIFFKSFLVTNPLRVHRLGRSKPSFKPAGRWIERGGFSTSGSDYANIGQRMYFVA